MWFSYKFYVLFIVLLVPAVSQPLFNEPSELVATIDGLLAETRTISENYEESKHYEDFYTVINLNSSQSSHKILLNFPVITQYKGKSLMANFTLNEEQLSLFPYVIAGFCFDYQLNKNCHGLKDAIVDQLKSFFNALESQAERIKLEQQVNWDFGIIDRVYGHFNNENLLSLEEKQNILNMKDYYTSNENLCLSGWRNFKISNNNFLTYVIHHDVASYNESVGYFNGTLPEVIKHVEIKSTVFFEYVVYREIFPFLLANGDWKGLKYILVSTYRNWKHAWPYICYEEISKKLALGEKFSYDVIPLLISKRSLLVSSVSYHSRNFKHAWDLLLNSLGYSMDTIKALYHIKPFYRNAFIAKPIWLERFSLFMSKATDSALFNHTVRGALQVKMIYYFKGSMF